MLSVRPWLATLFAWRRPLAAYGISSLVHAAALFALGMFIVHAEHQANAVPSLDAEFHVPPEESQAYLSAQASTATVDVVHSAGLVHGTGGGGGVGARMGVPLGIGIALKDIGGGGAELLAWQEPPLRSFASSARNTAPAPASSAPPPTATASCLSSTYRAA